MAFAISSDPGQRPRGWCPLSIRSSLARLAADTTLARPATGRSRDVRSARMPERDLFVPYSDETFRPSHFRARPELCPSVDAQSFQEPIKTRSPQGNTVH